MTVVFEGTYGGQSVKADGLATLKFKAPQMELANVVKSVLMIDKSIQVAIKMDDGNTYKVGWCSFNRLTTDRHGETVLQLDTDLNSMYMSLDQIRGLVDVSFQIVLR